MAENGPKDLVVLISNDYVPIAYPYAGALVNQTKHHLYIACQDAFPVVHYEMPIANDIHWSNKHRLYTVVFVSSFNGVPSRVAL